MQSSFNLFHIPLNKQIKYEIEAMYTVRYKINKSAVLIELIIDSLSPYFASLFYFLIEAGKTLNAIPQPVYLNL